MSLRSARSGLRLTVTAALVVASAAGASAQEPVRGFADAVLGRWDLVVHDPAGDYPSWLEIRLRSERELMASFVGRFGSVRHVTAIGYDDGALAFAVPVQYETGSRDLRFAATLSGATLAGAKTDGEGNVRRWTGRRAPALPPPAPTAASAPRAPSAPSAELPAPARSEWGEPVTLFDGRTLAGWQPRRGEAGCWSVTDGVLRVTPPCVDLVSERRFDDFKLHLEFRYPEGSNSGVYLRGRYEVQIQDDAGRALDSLRMGGVYGFLAPAVDAARRAGEWQTLDVTLLGRQVTVVLNGTTIIDGQEIPGITGGALDSDEGAPGPIMLQGDHGAIYFRAIEVTPRR